MTRPHPLPYLACLLAAATAYLFFFTHSYVGYYNDDAYYIIGARSLAHGSFAFLNKPGTPPIVEFLPGYSLLLAPVVRAFPHSLLALQASTLLFCLGILLLAWRHLAGGMGRGWDAAFIVLAGLQPSVLSSAGNVMAEPAYLFFSMLILLLYGRWREKMTPRRSAALGALLGFSIFLRPLGAALAAAMLACEWRGGRRASASRMAAVAAAMFCAWWARNVLVSDSNGYPFHQAREWALDLGGSGSAVASSFWGNTLENIRFYAFAFPRDMLAFPARLPAPWSDAFDLLAAIAFWAAVWSGMSTARARTQLERWYALGLLAILALWIHDPRYMLPASPLLTFFFVRGLEKASRGGRRTWAAGLAALAMAASISGAAALGLKVSRPNRYNTPTLRTFAWVRENTPADAVLLCSMGGRTYLYTGRRTQEFPSVLPRSQLRAFLAASGASHALLSREELIHNPASGRPAGELLRERGLYEIVFSDPAEGTLVLRLLSRRNPGGISADPAPSKAPRPR